ncbi:MAG: CotH kinase family protein [Nitriliruptoraceae bacterium]
MPLRRSHYCDPTGACGEAFHAGLRIHGNRSRAYAIKSLRLYARSEYGEPDHFEGFGFYEPPHGPHRRLLLRTSGQDHGELTFLDAYLQSLVDHLNVDTQASQPVAVFINGEYWGRHNLRERYDRHYLAATHGADPGTVVQLGTGLEVEAGADGADQPYRDLLEFVASADMGRPEVVAHIESQVDIDSFFDAVIVHVFVGNEDWPGNNMRLWRQPGAADLPGDGVLDGRWRWVVLDLDQTGGRRTTRGTSVRPLNADIDVFRGRFAPNDSTTSQRGYPMLFHRLMENPTLRERFVVRFADVLNTALHPDRTIPQLRTMAAQVESEMPAHIDRWGAPSSFERWTGYVARLEDFLRDRPDAQRAHLARLFALEGKHVLRVETDAVHGTVTVNSVRLDGSTPGVAATSVWQGTYFAGVPIRLTAQPVEGAQFVRWDGLDASLAASVADAQVELVMESDMVVTAIFRPA